MVLCVLSQMIVNLYLCLMCALLISIGCWQCERHHRPGIDWKGILFSESNLFLKLLFFDIGRASHSCVFYSSLYCFLQDPTQQTAIDNFMVHELDGTQNEWGWCKQKVIQGIFMCGYY